MNSCCLETVLELLPLPLSLFHLSSTMYEYDDEQDSGEFEFIGRRPHITINGGMGGAGGGGTFGGAGGRGDGPQFHIPGALGWKVHVNGNLITHTDAPCSDYRRIPMGDIILQSEIQTVISRQSLRQCSVRKLYSAALDGKTSRYIVAMYEGEGSKAEWEQDVARYMSIRHPHIFQIFAIAHSRTFNAAVFHTNSDLVNLKDFEAIYLHDSQMVFTYIRACTVTAYYSAKKYLEARDLSPYGFLFIHRSTGRLCIDISSSVAGLETQHGEPEAVFLQEDVLSLPHTLRQQVICKAMSLKIYHQRIYQECMASDLVYPMIDQEPEVRLGLVGRFCQQFFPRRVITHPLAFPSELHWRSCHYSSKGKDEHIHNGWVRMSSKRISSKTSFFEHTIELASEDTWISQANYIFKKAGITSDFENYYFTKQVRFKITVKHLVPLGHPLGLTPIPGREGYLWVCPAEHFRLGPSSFGWPECPAFWSLNPSGSPRLDLDEAARLGLPDLAFSTEIYGCSWDDNVYAGLREFHKAKGFDPYSQQVAIELGEPLYQLCSEVAEPFARCVAEDSSCDGGTGSECNGTQSGDDFTHTVTPGWPRLEEEYIQEQWEWDLAI
ncbi:hypothetical protein R3P38DRAFT_3117407, partial [Favolaschia claudopus]